MTRDEPAEKTTSHWEELAAQMNARNKVAWTADTWRILSTAYDWCLSTDGFFAGLTSGDMGWEPTELRVQPDAAGLEQSRKWLHDLIDHEQEVKKLKAELAERELATARACCRLACGLCAEGSPMEAPDPHEPGSIAMHRRPMGSVACRAQLIRDRYGIGTADVSGQPVSP